MYKVGSLVDDAVYSVGGSVGHCDAMMQKMCDFRYNVKNACEGRYNWEELISGATTLGNVSEWRSTLGIAVNGAVKLWTLQEDD